MPARELVEATVLMVIFLADVGKAFDDLGKDLAFTRRNLFGYLTFYVIIEETPVFKSIGRYDLVNGHSSILFNTSSSHFGEPFQDPISKLEKLILRPSSKVFGMVGCYMLSCNQ